jgi:hypothetical protein
LQPRNGAFLNKDIILCGPNPVIDPQDRPGDISCELQSPESHIDQTAMPRPPRRRRLWRWLAALALLPAGALWLNGPGLRWLAPKVAARYVDPSGARLRFTLEGSLSGGLTVHDLHLEGYQSLASLTVNRVSAAYRVADLLRGRVQGVTIDGLHAELRLGGPAPSPDSEPRQPIDLEQIVRTLRTVRGQLVPLAIDLSNISLNVTRDGKPVASLAPSQLHHGAGDASFRLNLGIITDASGRHWQEQQSDIVWNADDLSIQRIDPMPGVGVRDLVLQLPASGGPSAEAAIHIDDAVFMASATPGFSALSVDLREGRLRSAQVAEHFALELPATAALTSLAIHVNDLLPDPLAATGSARILLENVSATDWEIPELSLNVELEADSAEVAAQGRLLGSAFSIHAGTPVTRDSGGLHAGDVRGHLNLAAADQFVAALAGRVDLIDPAATMPPSTVDGDFDIAWKDLRPCAASVKLVLQPADPQAASPVQLRGQWHPQQPLAVQLEIDGLHAKADYNPASSTYQAGVEFTDFTSARIEHWLAVVRVGGGGAVSLTGNWQGGGDLAHGQHHGTLALARAEWLRAGQPPVTASGSIDYAWPGAVSTHSLRLQANRQTVTGDAKLAAGLLEITDLRWHDGTTEIAGGSASVPVPEDWSKWRDTLARDTRPVAVALESKDLSLALLHDWWPAAAQFDPRATGHLRLRIEGTFAEPVVDAVLDARELRTPSQPKLPPTALEVALTGRDGHLTVNGKATAADFPAAALTASMPFRPAAWAENPALISSEPVTARLDLPRIDLARFAALVPAARKITGTLTGNVELAGEVGAPVLAGKLDLAGGGVELLDGRHPSITGVAAAVDLTVDRITLRNLRATVAGGSLQAGGSLALAAGKPASLDFKATGKHLPVLRDDSVIVRANADLRLSGTWDQATLAGSVGVVDSLFYRDIELLPIGTPFTTPSAAALPKIDAPANPVAAMPEPFRNWRLDVLARTDNPLLIRGNFATGTIEGSVRVGGTLGMPAPSGEVRITDFRAALPFSTLTVRAGSARFTPATGFDPVLEIRGTAEPRPYQVNCYVYGRASNPQLVLTSNPPLPDNEIMTLLATGTTTTGLENPQAASARAMQLLAEELRRGRFAVGKQLRPLFGLLDRVDFTLAEADPYSNASYSTATLAISDHWYVSAGMSSEGDSRVLGIWRVTFR